MALLQVCDGCPVGTDVALLLKADGSLYPGIGRLDVDYAIISMTHNLNISCLECEARGVYVS